MSRGDVLAEIFGQMRGIEAENRAKLPAGVPPDLAFLQWLIEQGYHRPRPIGGGRYAAIRPLAFTHAIITGPIGDFTGYENQWCYHSLDAARAALDAWDGVGEPAGWHRHPATGRRRPDGDPGREVVRP